MNDFNEKYDRYHYLVYGDIECLSENYADKIKERLNALQKTELIEIIDLIILFRENDCRYDVSDFLEWICHIDDENVCILDFLLERDEIVDILSEFATCEIDALGNTYNDVDCWRVVHSLEYHLDHKNYKIIGLFYSCNFIDRQLMLDMIKFSSQSEESKLALNRITKIHYL